MSEKFLGYEFSVVRNFMSHPGIRIRSVYLVYGIWSRNLPKEFFMEVVVNFSRGCLPGQRGQGTSGPKGLVDTHRVFKYGSILELFDHRKISCAVRARFCADIAQWKWHPRVLNRRSH